jgi:peptidoglycan-associated lipoprotein
MNLTKLTHLLVLAAILTVAAAGCRKRPGYVTPIPAGRTGTPTSAGPTGPLGDGEGLNSSTDPGAGDISSTGAAITDPNNFAGWPEDAEKFKPYTVYFAFDSSAVSDSESSKISTVAEHMRANPNHALRIEGHADERGTDEYNRALGERRALAIREQLITAGVPANRVLTLSYGEDRPADSGQGETAWSRNRRGDFILLTPPGT